jgi:hypothetical protein
VLVSEPAHFRCTERSSGTETKPELPILAHPQVLVITAYREDRLAARRDRVVDEVSPQQLEEELLRIVGERVRRILVGDGGRLPDPPGALIENPGVGAGDRGGAIRGQCAIHCLEVLREPQIVAVEGADERRPRERNASIARCSRPPVLGLAYHCDAWVVDRLRNVGRAVVGAVVDDDQLPVRSRLAPDGLDCLSDRGGVVVRRHNDGECWG